jgi:hypothetical protein
MLSPTDILRLGRLYSAAEGITLATVGKRAIGNTKILPRLEAGLGANSTSLAKLETFFRANWPATAAWPADIVPGLRVRGKNQPLAGVTVSRGG